jgi:hypothetical protein
VHILCQTASDAMQTYKINERARFLMDKLELGSDTSSLVKALYWEEEPLEEVDI